MGDTVGRDSTPRPHSALSSIRPGRRHLPGDGLSADATGRTDLDAGGRLRSQDRRRRAAGADRPRARRRRARRHRSVDLEVPGPHRDRRQFRRRGACRGRRQHRVRVARSRPRRGLGREPRDCPLRTRDRAHGAVHRLLLAELRRQPRLRRLPRLSPRGDGVRGADVRVRPGQRPHHAHPPVRRRPAGRRPVSGRDTREHGPAAG